MPHFRTTTNEGAAYYLLATYPGQYGTKPLPGNEKATLRLEMTTAPGRSKFLFSIYADGRFLGFFSGHDSFQTLKHALLQAAVEFGTHTGRWRPHPQVGIEDSAFASESDRLEYHTTRSLLLRIIYSFRPHVEYAPEPLFVPHIVPVPSLFDDSDPETLEMQQEVMRGWENAGG